MSEFKNIKYVDTMKSFIKKICNPGDTNFWESLGILFLRLYLGGVMLLMHGIPKIDKGPSALPNPFNINATMNGLMIMSAELVCAGLILLGLLTRVASSVLFFCMFVAFFIFHSDDPFKAKELAFIYMMGYLALIFLGSGSLSVDKFIGKKS